MANRFLSNVNINDEYTLPSADGTADQIITTDGAGQLSFVDQSTISSGSSEKVVIYAKNTHTASIAKGTPVYITGTVGATDTVQIAPADASNSAKMPAVGLLDETLAVNDFGYVITGGFMDNITTDPIDGGTPSSNDTVYVKSGGGLTLTKPTGSQLIQNIAKVGKVSGGNSGSLIVSSILRTNDVPNLTTGKIWVGSSTYTTESGVVHLDETNNRLGINQTSPIGAVHIVGPNTNPAMTTSALVVEQGDGAKILIDGNDIDAAAGMLYLNDYSTNDVVFGGQIRVGGGGSPVGNSWFANGNVGIGTTSPSEKLDVVGSAQITNDIYLGRYIFHDGDTNTWLGFPLADTISFRTSGSDRMYITSAGNVGVGTTSPSSKLQVNGDLTVGDDGLVGSWINVIAAGASQDAGIRFGSESNTDSKAAIYTNTSNSDLHFDVTETTRMLIDSGTGNVGIGTTSPQGLLHVSSGTSGDAVVIIEADTDNNNENDNPQLQFKQDAGGIVAKAGLIGDPGQIFTNSLGNGTYFGTDSNASVQFYTNGAAALTIREDGDVGIGTNSPVDKLDVRGTARITSPQANDWIVLAQNYTTGAPSGFWDSNGNVHLYLRDSSSNTNVLIKSDSSSYFNGGNVGIGTSSPGAKLDVVSGDIRLGTNAKYLRVRDTASAQPRVLGMNSANTFYIGPIDSYAGGAIAYGVSGNVTYHGFYGGGSEKVRITSAGQIGIGLTAPQTALQLYGTADDTTVGGAHRTAIRLTSTYASTFGGGGELQFGLAPSTAGRDALSVVKGTYSAYSSGNYGGDLEFHTRDADGLGLKQRMTIAHDGNVGIGTTSPSYTLDVEGPIRGKQYLYLKDTGGTNRLTIQAESTYVTHSIGALAQNFVANYYRFYDDALSEMMRIADNGNVGIGTTSPGYKLDVDGDVRITQDNQLILSRSGVSGASSDSCIYVDNSYGSYGNPSNIDSDVSSFYGSRHITFRYNGTIVGHIQQSGTAGVAYNTTASDERLKKNIENWNENILDKFEQIEPKKFNFIVEDEGQDKTKGFIAQKMVADFPEAYPSDYSEEKYYSFNPSGMVVYLMKAIKELVEKNKVLEDRLQTLENK